MKKNYQNKPSEVATDQSSNLEKKVMPKIKVLYEDDSIFCIDKPFGLVVNRAETQKANITLQDWIDIHNPYIKTAKDSVFKERSGIVHRIDKDTTGVLVIAKNEEAYDAMQKLFADREIKKEYLALVYGPLSKLTPKFEINAPIGRNPRNREKYAVVENGREALTRFEIVEIITSKEYGEFGLLKCLPLTGRTHQIRVHLTAMGIPVIGDKTYSGKKRQKTRSDIFQRQMLHAHKISFIHPSTKENVEITADMPEDMASVINLLRSS